MSIHQLFEAKPGEQVVFALRRHPITFLRHIFIFLLMAVLPAVLVLLMTGGAMPTIENPFLHVGAVLLAGSYYLGIWTFFFAEFADYYLDISLITNVRILDIDQRGLFDREISELNLSRIQDVKSEVKGIISTLFNYGSVEVETAGAEENFRFRQVPHPHLVRQKILELAAQERKSETGEALEEAIHPGT